MREKTRGIFLRRIKYSDHSSVCTIYTEHYGRQSYMIRTAKTSRSRLKHNILQPLYLLDLEISHQSKRNIRNIKQHSICIPFSTIPYDFVKNSIALFLSEILYKTLQEEEENNDLFQFLFHAIQLLDVAPETIGTSVANFHLYFLLVLSKYLGFYPNNTYSSSNQYFDLQNGTFTSTLPGHTHFMDTTLSSAFYRLFDLSFHFRRNELLQISKKNRNMLLNKIMEYYNLHVPNFGSVKSLTVLNEVFNS